jgi:two-component system sensor histidine kinase KdpD
VEEHRPTPEELLERITAAETRAKRGRLKIFFGAAPGVGKTYAMLNAAQLKKRDGADVVIGWVETHGRVETDALTAGLERIPPRRLEYRGLQLRELDLDAALARKPAILIVDELAHTNAPGSRHARRFQDVEELLDAGIEVWTTLNVQHVESLNDVVAQITGVVVRETVPDSILEQAHEIELVDLTPDGLLKRLEEGKVYIPSQAMRAMESFFRKGNLIALRELALRRTAERVDQQVVEWKKEHGISQPWAMTERLLVAVGPAPQSANVIRAASRMAARLRAPWIALSVETPGFDGLTPEARERVASHLALAQRLGAETLVVRGDRLETQILAVARERNVTRIVVGKPSTRSFRERITGSLLDRLIRASGSIEVTATIGEEVTQPPQIANAARPATPPLQYLGALATIAIPSAAGVLLRSHLQTVDQAMLLLLGVVLCARRFALWPSILATVASVAAFDYLFVPPYYTFAVSDARYVLTFAVMLAVGFTVSRLTLRIRADAESARERERRTAALFAMSRDLVLAETRKAVVDVAMKHLRDFFAADAVVHLAEDAGALPQALEAGPGPAQGERDGAIARWVHDHGKPAGHGTATLPGSDVLFLPLIGSTGPLGVLGIALGRRAKALTPSQRQLLETFVAQIAQALDRMRLSEDAAAARVAAETERTRSTLLSAVSHDLRTPLAVISGATEALMQVPGSLDAEGRRDLLATIREEADRLTRIINDLLDLTRLEAGGMRVQKEWHPLEEVIASALSRLASKLRDRPVELRLSEKMILVPIDAALVEQVLVNLIENATKYGDASQPIEVDVRVHPDEVEVEVLDRGKGIPPGEEDAIFERFYRATDSQRAEGTGLGLAISRAIVRAHGGRIMARARDGGGSVFGFTLPLEGEPPRVLEE